MLKKLTTIFYLVFFSSLIGYTTNSQNIDKSKDETYVKEKTMVIYFSATNTTENIAKKIADELNVQLYEIKPTSPYTENDLNWHDNSSRANKEQKNKKIRPNIKQDLPDLNDFSTIYLGFPIWWGIAPRVVYTFIDSVNLDGKTVHIFCTSGSSPSDEAKNDFKKQYPNIKWGASKRFEKRDSKKVINEWLKEIS